MSKYCTQEKCKLLSGKKRVTQCSRTDCKDRTTPAGVSDWYVQKYGTIIDDYETKQGGCFIRQKIYRYEGNHYLETWVNGIRTQFIELEIFR